MLFPKSDKERADFDILGKQRIWPGAKPKLKAAISAWQKLAKATTSALMRLLAGDVGGTKTYLCLYEQNDAGEFVAVAETRYESAAFQGLTPMVEAFLGSDRQIDAAAFGVAGPVVNDECRATNLPWKLSARAMEKDLSIPKVRLINDFHAVALGVPVLKDDQLCVLQDAPIDPKGAIAIIGAGTGLGEGVALPSEKGLQVIASEGGHTDFAPRNDLEVDLLRFLLKRHARVSYERVVSGPGLHTVYEFLISSGRAEELPETRAQMREMDPSAVIGMAATSGSDPACVMAVEVFVSAYGAEAGNLALKVIPHGGLFIAGGVAVKLIESIKQGGFMESFLFKGRMSTLLEGIRVAVVMEQKVGLLGAREQARLSALGH